MVELLYGTGIRVGECCALRIRDIDLGRAQIIVRAGKGDKDRLVMLPARLQERLAAQVRHAETVWRRDLQRGGGYAPVPDALAHKRPRAGWAGGMPTPSRRFQTTGCASRVSML